MPLVEVNGVFMGASTKEQTFDGKTKVAVYIDVYQPDSDDTEKMLQIKSDDIALALQLNKDYSMGSIFKALTSVNAYKNKAYFKLKKIVE